MVLSLFPATKVLIIMLLVLEGKMLNSINSNLNPKHAESVAYLSLAKRIWLVVALGFLFLDSGES